MEKFSLTKSEPIVKKPQEGYGFFTPEQVNKLKEMQEQKAALAKKIAVHENELKRRVNLSEMVKKAEAELAKREKVKQIEKKTEQGKTILEGIRNLITGRKMKIALAVLGLSAGTIAIGSNTGTKMNHMADKKEISAENENTNEIKKLYSEVKEKIDTNFYRDLSESAQTRYVSMIVKDIKDREDSIDRHNGVISDSLDNEYDSKEIERSELMRMCSSAGESGGDYSIPCSASNACGYDQVMPSAWFPAIHLNPNDTNDIRYFMDHPEKQDEAWDAIFNVLDTRAGDNPQKFFAGLLLTGTGPDDVGTPRGDVPADAFGTTVNGYVKGIMPRYNKLFDATKDGGRWVVDSERQKKYWVDLKYHKRFEKDIYPVIKNSRNEQWVGPIGQKNIKESQSLAKIFAKELRTADFVQEFNENNEKLIPFKELHPNDPKIRSKKSYVRRSSSSSRNSDGDDS